MDTFFKNNQEKTAINSLINKFVTQITMESEDDSGPTRKLTIEASGREDSSKDLDLKLTSLENLIKKLQREIDEMAGGVDNKPIVQELTTISYPPSKPDNNSCELENCQSKNNRSVDKLEDGPVEQINIDDGFIYKLHEKPGINVDGPNVDQRVPSNESVSLCHQPPTDLDKPLQHEASNKSLISSPQPPKFVNKPFIIQQDGSNETLNYNEEQKPVKYVSKPLLNQNNTMDKTNVKKKPLANEDSASNKSLNQQISDDETDRCETKQPPMKKDRVVVEEEVVLIKSKRVITSIEDTDDDETSRELYEDCCQEHENENTVFPASKQLFLMETTKIIKTMSTVDEHQPGKENTEDNQEPEDKAASITKENEDDQSNNPYEESKSTILSMPQFCCDETNKIINTLIVRACFNGTNLSTGKEDDSDNNEHSKLLSDDLPLPPIKGTKGKNDPRDILVTSKNNIMLACKRNDSDTFLYDKDTINEGITESKDDISDTIASLDCPDATYEFQDAME